MDKFEKILDIIDHQEKYSDEEIREILQDEECRKLYQTMVEVDSALENPSPIINIDEEWQLQAGDGLRHRPHHRPCHRVPEQPRQEQAILSTGSPQGTSSPLDA